ncbi:MAG: DsbA family protein, partial [Hyphomonadaceae bacterium]|nr:DsbA family protein [Hyphomonadaceae bacterium]
GSFPMAFASASRRLAPVATLAAAALLLAACGDQTQTAADGFKPVPVTPVLGDVPMGQASAPVTIEEYASYTCSHCRDFWKQEFPRLKTEYIDTGKVKFIYRDYPLDNSLAVMLASVARCKGPDSYFAVVDDIFSKQYEILTAAPKGEVGPIILDIAQRHGMTQDEVRTCIDHQPALKNVILKSREDGTARGVKATPTVFVNGEQLMESGYEPLKAAIEAKLNPGAAPATPAPAEGAPASTSGQ